MRFLCLHGAGTNSHVFEMQTSAIRYGLGDQHTYDFVDGSVATAIAPGMESFISPEDSEFLKYADETSAESCRNAVSDLEQYLEEEGPFDGVMAFSQGASIAATLLILHKHRQSQRTGIYPPFRCAIFFSGGVPENLRDYLADEDTYMKQKLIDYEKDHDAIEIPTAHSWGGKDSLLRLSMFGPGLSKICRPQVREEFVHEHGHAIPGAGDPAAVEKIVRIIKRTIDRAQIA